MSFLQWLRHTSLATFLSEDPYMAYVLLCFHAIGMAAVVGLVWVMALRSFGFPKNLSIDTFRTMATIALWGFAINAVSGVLLFMSKGPLYVQNTEFLIKMGAILLGAIGVFAMLILQRRLAAVPTEETKSQLPLRIASIIVAALAATLWLVAIIYGRQIAYTIRPPFFMDQMEAPAEPETPVDEESTTPDASPSPDASPTVVGIPAPSPSVMGIPATPEPDSPAVEVVGSEPAADASAPGETPADGAAEKKKPPSILDPFGKWLEATPLGVYMRGNPDAFPTAEMLHFVGLTLLFGAMLIVDLRMIGVFRQASYGSVLKLLPFAVLGFVINLATGLAFIATNHAIYTTNPAFYWKLGAVLLGGLNALWFTFAEHRQIAGLPKEASVPMPAKLMAGLSLALWLSVLIAGRLLPVFADVGGG
jgi:hypothetical protein